MIIQCLISAKMKMRTIRKVSSFIQGDEMNYDRLSSFLYKNGMLDTRDMNSINRNVFYIKTFNDKSFILKKHRNKTRMEQQWSFFEQIKSPDIIPFEHFPNQKKFIYDKSYYWTISPYIRGKKLNYLVDKDRIESLETLKKFHGQASGINVLNRLKKDIFYLRWYKRLQTFKKTYYIFEDYHFKSLFEDIVQTTEKQLQIVSEIPWNRLEQKAKINGNWVHGDVASHNFIRNQKRIFIIDFDLLLCAPQLYDYIQLGQRFLPYINWNLNRLLSYNMVEERYLKAWLLAILIPSDVLREWIHFLYNTSNRSIHNYLSKMEADWLKRQSFLNSAKLMLKSM